MVWHGARCANSVWRALLSLLELWGEQARRLYRGCDVDQHQQHAVHRIAAVGFSPFSLNTGFCDGVCAARKSCAALFGDEGDAMK